MEGGSTGLIPSQTLEEKRKAFVKRDVELAPAGSLEKIKPKRKKTKLQSPSCDIRYKRIMHSNEIVTRGHKIIHALISMQGLLTWTSLN